MSAVSAGPCWGDFGNGDSWKLARVQRRFVRIHPRLGDIQLEVSGMCVGPRLSSHSSPPPPLPCEQEDLWGEKVFTMGLIQGGSTLVSGGRDGRMRIWEVQDDRPKGNILFLRSAVSNAHNSKSVFALANLGETICSAGGDRTIKVSFWLLSKHQRNLKSIFNTQLWNMDASDRDLSWNNFATLYGHTELVSALATTHGGSGTYCLFINLETKNFFRPIYWKNSRSLLLSCSPESENSSCVILYSLGMDNAVKVWDPHTLQCLATLQLPSQPTSLFLASSALLFAGSESGLHVIQFTFCFFQVEKCLRGRC